MTNRYSLVPVVLGPHAGKALAQRQTQVVLHPPLKLPLGSSRHAPWNGPWIQRSH